MSSASAPPERVAVRRITSAIGWEGWSGHGPETGESFVVLTNT